MLLLLSSSEIFPSHWSILLKNWIRLNFYFFLQIYIAEFVSSTYLKLLPLFAEVCIPVLTFHILTLILPFQVAIHFSDGLTLVVRTFLTQIWNLSMPKDTLEVADAAEQTVEIPDAMTTRNDGNRCEIKRKLLLRFQKTFKCTFSKQWWLG